MKTLDFERISSRNFQVPVPKSVQAMVGKKFGRLLVLHWDGREGEQTWAIHFLRCRCDCGVETSVLSGYLKAGRSTSCDCYRKERAMAATTKHGCARDSGRTKEYRAHCHMLERCEKSYSQEFHRYGGRGIKVCSRFHSFQEFLAKMGICPKGLSLDRIKNDLHYSCGECDECRSNGWEMNCRWATYEVQANNTSRNVHVVVGGETLTATQAARKYGLRPHLVLYRVSRGMVGNDLIKPAHRRR